MMAKIVDYDIRPCDVHDIPSLTALLDHAYQIQNPEKEALIRWKFFDPVHGGATISFGAFTPAGELTSQYANVPVVIQGDGHVLQGMVCVDMTTHRDHRGQGLISRLSKEVYANVCAAGFDLSIGFSNEAGVKVDQHATAYGYRVVGAFSRYVYRRLRSKATPYCLSPAISFSKLADRLLPVADSPYGIAKTIGYLNWRYLKKPCNDYQIYELSNAGYFAGYVVIRHSTRGAYIYDLIADFADIQPIQAAIHNWLRAHGQSAAIWYVLDNAFWRQTLRNALRIPNRLAPDNYYLTVKIHSEQQLDRAAILSPDRWRMMAGDIL
jgi:GNAT superfamily N-acetyltransferase